MRSRSAVALRRRNVSGVSSIRNGSMALAGGLSGGHAVAGEAAPAAQLRAALGAQAGLRAHQQLVEAALGRLGPAAEHRAQPAAEEAERNRDDARERQRGRRAL